MHIHAKLIAGLLMLLLGIATSITLAVNLYLLPHLQVIEEYHLGVDLDRAKRGLELEQQRLASLAYDWGQWDDTYNYMLSRDPSYVASNLHPGVLSTLNVDLLALITTDGEMLQLNTTDSARESQSLHGKHLPAEHPLRQATGAFDTHGIIHMPDGMMLIASSPILPSERLGAARGTLIFGRMINSDFQQNLADATRLPVQLAITRKKLDNALITFPSDNISHAQQSIAFFDDPATHLLITLQQTRPYYEQAKAVLRLTLQIIGSLGLIVSLLAYLFLKSTIVKPILILKKQVDRFGRFRSLREFKPLKQNDELGELSFSFINMARQLVASQGALEQERQRYMDASYTDPLTQLHNRRFMERYFTEHRSANVAEPVLLMMVDLDHFKHVNDRYGHDTGDQVLRELAKLLQQTSRDGDLVVRYGGEEFTLICRNTNEATACTIAERIRAEVETFQFCADSTPIRMTCSVGFFSCQNSSPKTAADWYAMVKVADLALYAAKNSGRNMWVGLNADRCEQPFSWPTENDTVLSYIQQKVLTSYHYGGSERQIHWG